MNDWFNFIPIDEDVVELKIEMEMKGFEYLGMLADDVVF